MDINRLPLVGKPYDKNHWETILLPSFTEKRTPVGASFNGHGLASEAVVGLPVPWIFFTGA